MGVVILKIRCMMAAIEYLVPTLEPQRLHCGFHITCDFNIAARMVRFEGISQQRVGVQMCSGVSQAMQK